MRKTLFTIVLATSVMLMTGCSSSEKKDNKEGEPEAEQTFMTDDDIEYTELKKVPLPCEKDLLYTAWKQIGSVELQRKKTLDYKTHTPTLVFSTDLDDDGTPEILLRSDPPYAAIYTMVKDTLQLITFADHPEMGLAITQDGAIIRNVMGQKGSTFSEFIRLEKGQIVASGAVREKFSIKNGAMVSDGIEYMLKGDTAMVKVSKDEYQAVAPHHEGTFLEEIEGWEDFRTP